MSMPLRTQLYQEQQPTWPRTGRHILAQFDDDSIIVYQAYRPSIGRFAAENGIFGGEFSYQRMSWIKPNFLWMMYRSGWGTKSGQEVTLAVRLTRDFFERVLASAVPSSFVSELYESKAEWKAAIQRSDVRLQWDPDHDPYGASLERRALQLGLRGAVLGEYGREAVLEIVDISSFVASQREFLEARDLRRLEVPYESVFVPQSAEARKRIGLDLDVPGTIAATVPGALPRRSGDS